jgi:hypothetical protein
VHRNEQHRVRTRGDGFLDQRDLLLDIVGTLGHVVHDARAEPRRGALSA